MCCSFLFQRDVHAAVAATGTASCPTVIGSADATVAGTDLTAAFLWRRLATTASTMIMVRNVPSILDFVEPSYL